MQYQGKFRTKRVKIINFSSKERTQFQILSLRKSNTKKSYIVNPSFKKNTIKEFNGTNWLHFQTNLYSILSIKPLIVH